MREEAVRLLRCPLCGRELRLRERTLCCAERHSFDLARQGYVNLLGRHSPRNADTAEMVAARERWLGAGWYLPIAEAVAEAVAPSHTIVEVGAGTGYYLAHTLTHLDGGLGLATDVSVPACRRAARAHPLAAAIVADTWAGLPLGSHAFDAVLCVFAPRNYAEFRRLLARSGQVVVVVPNEGHLAELRAANGLLTIPAGKAADVEQQLGRARVRRIRFPLELTAAAAADLVGMGPNAFHGRGSADGLLTQADVSVIVGRA